MNAMDVVLDSKPKSVSFSDVAVGGVFEIDGTYFMKIFAVDGANAIKLKSPKADTDEATDNEDFKPYVIPFGRYVIPRNSTLSIEV